MTLDVCRGRETTIQQERSRCELHVPDNIGSLFIIEKLFFSTSCPQ